MDTCGKCNSQWHSICGGKMVIPLRVPICADGSSIMVVCTECVEKISPKELGEIAQAKYIASSKTMLDSPVQLSEAAQSIQKFVDYRASLAQEYA